MTDIKEPINTTSDGTFLSVVCENPEKSVVGQKLGGGHSPPSPPRNYPLYLLERKTVCKPANIDITTQRNNANDSFGKGFDVLEGHVLNSLMTGRCLSKSLQLWPKFHLLFLQNSFDFQKSATFKKE